MAYEWWIGARYAGLGRWRGRGNDRFVSFVAFSSMTGIALGVAALIIVLSVMNGFQIQVRDRMLSVLPHIELTVPGMGHEYVLRHWQDLAEQAKDRPEVRAAAPFVASQAMLARGRGLSGVQVRGIDPSLEPGVSDLAGQMIEGALDSLAPGRYHLILGTQLARALGVGLGDTVLLLAPEGSVSPAGFAPRMRQFTVSGIFASGHYEYDSSLVFIDVQDAAKVFRGSGTSGVRLRIGDMQQAPRVAQALLDALPAGVLASDWTQNNRTWFAAVQTEKRMMFLILALIVAVAAFNLLSSLVMAVKDKRADIAILRTLGATPGQVARIFLIQGALIGVMGTALGVAGGTLVAFHVDVIVPWIERLLGIHFLPQQIYFISELPSNPQLADILVIGGTSLALSLLATIYPGWRAARLQPARILRHD
ncbi:lipoprotein-releasing ABC transporter permease subunit [Castellaniella sp.]|uniref:lipoprotein-releasing ABC transporter permease subunit n=1 Tax=Castellaniella sp. TaxID=1955812 RepID=UPI0035624B92